jgi:hypothetical protein
MYGSRCVPAQKLDYVTGRKVAAVSRRCCVPYVHELCNEFVEELIPKLVDESRAELDAPLPRDSRNGGMKGEKRVLPLNMVENSISLLQPCTGYLEYPFQNQQA